MRLIKKTIAECLRSRVRESADCIALEADKQQYTWRDLDTLSDYMVGRMFSCGIKKGTHVALCGCRVCLLRGGLQKAGI